MRFDWYQTTIEEKPLVVLETLKKLGHSIRPADGLAKQYRYRQGWQIEHDSRGVVATMFAGGNGEKPHALATSEHTDAFVDLVRSCWPEQHLVTRADVAQDFNEAGCYDRLRPITRRIAKRHRLAFPQIADDLHDKRGRTQYVGSEKSDYRVRLYEKGWEQAAKLLTVFTKHGEPTPMVENLTVIKNEATGEFIEPANWTRLEFQARPRQEQGRRAVALAEPSQVWGVSPWALELARETMALDLERIVVRTKKVSTTEKALRFAARQYGRHFAALAEDIGWECVGWQLKQWMDEEGV